MKINDASLNAVRPLLSFNSFLIQEHLRRGEVQDVFLGFQQEFDEKVPKLKAGVWSLTKKRSSTVLFTKEAF